MANMKTLRESKKNPTWLSALAGILSAGLVLGIAELIGAFFTARATPLIALGSTFIDFTPAWMKNFAVETFGTGDKAALFVGMGITITLLAGVLGIVAYRKWLLGCAGVVLMGIIMSTAVITRAGTGYLDAVPSVIGTIAGIFALKLLTDKLYQSTPISEPADEREDQNQHASRRSFFIASGITGLVAIAAAGAGRAIGGVRNKIQATRESLRFPRPQSSAPSLPAKLEAPVDGTVPWLTPNNDFYRIDTALSVPLIDVSTWEIRVHGMVEEEFTMTFQDLLDAGLVERHITLTCVSNPVGGNLVGNAKWLGYPLQEVLKRAKPKNGANMVLSTSEDGFSASTALSVLQDNKDAMLAVSMNDEPLPLEHGYPVRMVVPGLYGYVSATKWVVDLEVTRFEDKTAYWTDRGWSEKGPIKTMARIEVPASFAKMPSGKVMIAGSAWSQGRGITKVEVQLDGGEWQSATLADEANVNTWRQWYLEMDVASGVHNIRARATDAKDGLQTETRADPIPDGASGWQTVNFTAQ
jgi:DMSO/TMAO reductase YedYZ molybdopterin-dependent catalytic subunit